MRVAAAVLLAVGGAAVSACLVVRTLYLLHMLQLEEYSVRAFTRWAVGHVQRLVANLWVDLLAIAGLLALVVRPDSVPSLWVAGCIAALLGIAGFLVERRLTGRTPAKKPLVMTGRAWRLLSSTMVVDAGLVVCGWYLDKPAAYAVLAILPLVTPVVLLVGRMLVEPVEALIRRWFIRDAQRILRQYDPVVIGVTGSYGKTSTKYFIEQLLQSRYHVLKTPASYNTAMGITRTVREQLRPEHEVFVVELAENEPGGFGHLLEIVPCDLSVVTSVGIQHLEEFGSADVIERTMKDFVAMPQSGGAVILNGDDPVLAQVPSPHDKTIIRVCTAGGDTAGAFCADKIVAGPDGLAFEVRDSSEHTRYQFNTSVLGRYNVINVLLALAVARQLDVSWEELQARASLLKSPPHRLEILTTSPGVRVIDDAFNANPAGFAMAMEVLASFPPRRILVTPGLVSLGPLEEAANRQAGMQAAKAADLVVLVGARHTQPLRDGLTAAGFPVEAIVSVRSLDEVTHLIGTIVRPGDTVLFENDLPDTYDE
ncbi:MAG TPA: UDP-N-acetylmuramoyl-tripeptide--D-alanyl-D-alanine ligase [Candidatus Cryosericum sp.]|nr:UDP-N-acetylmuramoyl-tripeptide--D-alanyl-D-alanine ligase [Candidatus Cryosericum sp.]